MESSVPLTSLLYFQLKSSRIAELLSVLTEKNTPLRLQITEDFLKMEIMIWIYI